MDAKIEVMRQEIKALNYGTRCPHCGEIKYGKEYVSAAVRKKKADVPGVCPACGEDVLYDDFFPAEDQFVTFYLDKQPTNQELAEIELALNSRSPEWGEYELAFCSDDAVSMHVAGCSEPEPAPEPEAVKALKFLIEGMGYKVTEIPGYEEDGPCQAASTAKPS